MTQQAAGKIQIRKFKIRLCMLIDLLVIKPGNTLIVFRLISDKKVMPGFTVRVPPELHGCTNADVTVIVKQIALRTVAATPAVPRWVWVETHTDARTNVVEPTTLPTFVPGVRGKVDRQPARAKRAWAEEIRGRITEPVVVAKPLNDQSMPQLVSKLTTECAVPRHWSPGGFTHSGVKRDVDVHVSITQKCTEENKERLGDRVVQSEVYTLACAGEMRSF